MAKCVDGAVGGGPKQPRTYHPQEWCGFCKRNVQRRDNAPNCFHCDKPFADTTSTPWPFDVGDHVAFRMGDDRGLQGRVLAISDTEYAVEDCGKIYWVSKDEVSRG